MRTIFLFSLPTLLTVASAYCPPTVFLLAGDSTTASLSANGGGWGDGFNATLVPPGVCENHALNGRSTKTFIDNGDWGRLLESAESFSEKEYRVFVTIQFGHNDQKLVDFEEQFKTNLKAMVGDVKGKGGVPVLVTPLARRNFWPNGTLNDILSPWAGYVREVAEEMKANSIDLWKESKRLLEAVGETQARRIDLADGDHTHLNHAAEKVFGRMVADLLVAELSEKGRKRLDVRCVVGRNETMSREIKKGVMSF